MKVLVKHIGSFTQTELNGVTSITYDGSYYDITYISGGAATAVRYGKDGYKIYLLGLSS